jgi:hypothetical protein
VSANDGELRRLLDEVKRTKGRHRLELRGRVETPTVQSTREEALVALEVYTAALDARRLPVPRDMQRDLKLLRVLCVQAARRRL